MSNFHSRKFEDHKTAHAYKNNKLVHIGEVSSGLNCGCICVKCKEKLIAKKGSVRVHHFAHAANSDCYGAAETTLHLLSKELISNLSIIHLPQYNLKKEKKLKSGLVIKHEGLVVKGGQATISKAAVEQAEDSFIPDVTLESNSKTLFVEISVTHKVDRAKLRNIRKLGKAAIEIQLDVSDARLSREELSYKLQNEIEFKKWLFHPRQRKIELEYINKARSLMRQSRQSAIHSSKRIFVEPNLYSEPSAYNFRAGRMSNAKLDRLIYQFFRKFGRQPNEEEVSRIESILYGVSIAK